MLSPHIGIPVMTEVDSSLTDRFRFLMKLFQDLLGPIHFRTCSYVEEDDLPLKMYIDYSGGVETRKDGICTSISSFGYDPLGCLETLYAGCVEATYFYVNGVEYTFVFSPTFVPVAHKEKAS